MLLSFVPKAPYVPDTIEAAIGIDSCKRVLAVVTSSLKNGLKITAMFKYLFYYFFRNLTGISIDAPVVAPVIRIFVSIYLYDTEFIVTVAPNSLK